MTTRPAAEVGMTLEEVDTPALLIEFDAFEANLRALADTLAGTSVKLRPHGKAHKCPVIGHKQMALGAVGLCCQKVSEAEAMVFGGLSDIYVTNEIVGARKLARLAPLAHQARIATCIDNPLSVAPLSEAAETAGVEIRVLVDLDVGHHRCGVEPGDAAVPLARAIDKAKGLWFGGLQAYHGKSQHFRTHEERGAAIKGACESHREDHRGAEESGTGLRRGERRRHRHLSLRGGERSLYRIAGRVLYPSWTPIMASTRPRTVARSGTSAKASSSWRR